MTRADVRDTRSGLDPLGPTGTAVCAFAVCPTSSFAGAPRGSLADLGHVRGGPVTLLTLDQGLSVLVQEVPSAEFTQEALTRRLSDRAELESCARAHHATVVAAAAQGPVVPLPLATLFSDPKRARALLVEKMPHFHAVLAHVENRSEWAVKVCQLRCGPRPPSPSSDPSDGPEGTGTGLAYLDRVRTRERDRLTRHAAAATAVGHVHQVLARLAVDHVRRHRHGQEITGRDHHQLLNAAYLVPRERTNDFQVAVGTLVGELTGTGVHVEVSGPWVPYSFAGPTERVGTEGVQPSAPGTT